GVMNRKLAGLTGLLTTLALTAAVPDALAQRAAQQQDRQQQSQQESQQQQQQQGRQEQQRAQNGESHTGELVRVQENQIVMSAPEVGRHSHQVTDETQITLNGRPARLEDLRQGDRLRV